MSAPDILASRDAAVAAARAVAELLALSDERDRWQRRLLGGELAAYRAGYCEGRAAACVALAEIEARYEAAARWREFAAQVRRVVLNDRDPSVRMGQVMAEIAADREFARCARAKQAKAPASLTPLEHCVLTDARFGDPGDVA